MDLLTSARRAFYNAGGPWVRRGVFEALGSQRYSRPAHHQLDRQLDALIDRDGGVFLEAGAHDGYTQSNTYWLERHRGWTGVLVEPVPELHAKAARRRRRSTVVQAAIVAPEDRGTVTMRFGDLMSTVGDAEHAAGGLRPTGRAPYSVEVPARTLDDVLDQAGVGDLDLVSLDLEGLELPALRGLDFDRRRVGVLLVELLEMERDRPAVDALLAPWFDPAGQLSHIDALYRWRG